MLSSPCNHLHLQAEHFTNAPFFTCRNFKMLLLGIKFETIAPSLIDVQIKRLCISVHGYWKRDLIYYGRKILNIYGVYLFCLLLEKGFKIFCFKAFNPFQFLIIIGKGVQNVMAMKLCPPPFPNFSYHWRRGSEYLYNYGRKILNPQNTDRPN